MSEHFINLNEAYGNGYPNPKEVHGAFLPSSKVRPPHTCLPECRPDSSNLDVLTGLPDHLKGVDQAELERQLKYLAVRACACGHSDWAVEAVGKSFTITCGQCDRPAPRA